MPRTKRVDTSTPTSDGPRMQEHLTQIQIAIEVVVEDSMYSPNPVLATLDTMIPSETYGRIEKSPHSALVYCLRLYLSQRIQVRCDFPAGHACIILGINDIGVTIEYSPDAKAPNRVRHTFTVAWPEWLFEFFEDEEHEALLSPDNTEKLMEVIQILHEFVRANGYNKIYPKGLQAP